MARRHSIETPSLPSGTPRALSEIGNGTKVELEPVAPNMDVAELEAFMQEDVVIRVHPSREPGSLPVITPSVNDKNQPIIRGKQQPVKRKYVEVLARSYSINYEQQVPDASQPDRINMLGRAVPDYPFEVIEDTKRGKAWLERIYEQVQAEAARA